MKKQIHSLEVGHKFRNKININNIHKRLSDRLNENADSLTDSKWNKEIKIIQLILIKWN